jgi:hypothetical protein
MNKPAMQERDPEPELLIADMPPIQAHASFQSPSALATVTRMPVAEHSEPETPSQVILRLSSDPNFSIEKLDRLVAMFREQEKDKQRQLFNAAMVACQSEMKPVVRNAENPDTHSRYATFDKVAEAIVPIYTKHGFSVSYGTDTPQVEGCYGVTALVSHNGGFERFYRADIPSDRTGKQGTVNKTGTHAFGSTMSYARRYLALLIFNIATKGSDDDGNAAGGKTPPELISQEQVKTLQRRLVSLGVDVPKFYHNFAIERLEDLGVPQFDRAMQLLDQREKAAQAKDPSGTLRKQLQESAAQAGGQAR